MKFITEDKRMINLLLVNGADRYYLKYENIKQYIPSHASYSVKKFLNENTF